MRWITASQAARAVCRVFSFAARNSGPSTSLRMDSAVGFSLVSMTIGKLAALAISLSPVSTIARTFRA